MCKSKELLPKFMVMLLAIGMVSCGIKSDTDEEDNTNYFDTVYLNVDDGIEKASEVVDESSDNDTTMHFLTAIDISNRASTVAGKYSASAPVLLEASVPYEWSEEVKMAIKEDGDTMRKVYDNPPEIVSYPTHYFEVLFNSYETVVGKGDERNYGVINQKRCILTRDFLLDEIIKEPEQRKEVGERMDILYYFLESFDKEKIIAQLSLHNPVGSCEFYEFQIVVNLKTQKIIIYEIERKYYSGYE